MIQSVERNKWMNFTHIQRLRLRTVNRHHFQLNNVDPDLKRRSEPKKCRNRFKPCNLKLSYKRALDIIKTREMELLSEAQEPPEYKKTMRGRS